MSVFVLKIIACAAMLIDHFGAAIMLPNLGEPGFGPEIYVLTRSVGRIAFPIFAYLIAQGCVHTKNIGKYLARLGLLAIVSEPFFDMAFWGGDINFLRNTNIFYTLFLGAATVAILEKAREAFGNGKPLSTTIFYGTFIVGALFAPAMAAYALGADYSFIGVGIIFLIYILRPESRFGRTIALAIGMAALYSHNINYLMFSFVAIGLIALYNGKLGTSSPAIKWGFYFFYPAHLAALVAARMFIFQ